MKTSFNIRTFATGALLALAAFTFASKSFAAVDAFIWFESPGKTTVKVPVQSDGSYTTPPLSAGSYTVSYVINRGPRQTTSTDGSKLVSGYSLSSGGDSPTESVSLNFTKISWTYDVKAPRDAATGQASGKRQHKSLDVNMSESERLLPTVNKRMGTIEVVIDGDGLTGSVVCKTSDGQAIKPGWNLKENVK